MGLAVSQMRLLTLTGRKADIEFDLTRNSDHKMLLSNDQINLSREYSARLQGKDITYYANGQYNKVNYNYLMGSGINTAATLWDNPKNIKSDNSMILTDSSGLVVMSGQYANAMKKVLGNGCISASGKGGTFSTDKIPAIIAEVAGFPVTEDMVKDVLNGKTINNTWDGTGTSKNTKTLETTDTNI